MDVRTYGRTNGRTKYPLHSTETVLRGDVKVPLLTSLFFPSSLYFKLKYPSVQSLVYALRNYTHLSNSLYTQYNVNDQAMRIRMRIEEKEKGKRKRKGTRKKETETEKEKETEK